ncbi:hypothetical protein [Candidatus Soleaferrea massiliensis]|uniref:hypothetical protein n=1 Tax=Candidatus Soleaferrea massiliensis TaxID=1470354 RepID=UPI000590E655|nr:hypothetical protein [Candidatus Soleaferrea massiliensis]
MDTRIRIIAIMFALIMCLTLVACNAGKTDQVSVSIGTSSKFSLEDIENAVQRVKEKFKDFEDCELLELWYDETADTSTSKNSMVLLSNFKVGPSGGNGSLEPNSTYTEWQWILIRDNTSDNWLVKDWGYG